MLPLINMPGPLSPRIHRNSYTATQSNTVFTAVDDDKCIVLCGLVLAVTADATAAIEYSLAFGTTSANPATITIPLSGGAAPVVIGGGGGILAIGPPGVDLVISVGALEAGRIHVTVFSFIIPRISI